MKIISNKLIADVSTQAKLSPRKRQNYNFHETLNAIVQRMLNAIEPDTYVHPHKHETPDKVESFIILKGKVLVIEFDDEGNITSSTVLCADNGILGAEIAPRTWHSIVSLESGTVVYEVKEGPYSPINDKNFAPWAPKEGSSGCREYINQLLKRCFVELK
ncbi:MAG TPA: WbuC family cupin fold metalloprotein [Bacteroidales bacterium]